MTTYVGESVIPYAPVERPLYLKTTIQFESPIPVTREVHTAATQALMGDWANLAFEAVHEHDGAWVEEIAEYRAIAYEVPEEMDERLRWLLGWRRASRMQGHLAFAPEGYCEVGAGATGYWDAREGRGGSALGHCAAGAHAAAYRGKFCVGTAGREG